MMYTMKILPEYLKLIREGKKRAEVRKWYKNLEGQKVGLTYPDDNKIRLVIEIGPIYDIRNIDPEDKELLLDEALVSPKFRNSYPCNYIYTITNIEEIQ
jgi:ASC-1-like (ASCH) protein